MRRRKGSALVMAIWIIAVLSVLVISFSVEAYMENKINTYVSERNRVDRLIEAGKIIGEVILSGYKDASDWAENEDADKLLEDDRWYMEKRMLKSQAVCVVGPLLIDEENPGSGTVKIEIQLVNSGAEGGININRLFEGQGGDSNSRLRLQMIFKSAGLHEEIEVDDEEGNRVNLVNMLTAAWFDWRDQDDTVAAIDGESLGAEKAWYAERDEEQNLEGEERSPPPRNGEIPNIQELAMIKGFRQYPAVLIGGLLHPDEEESVDNPRLKGVASMFGTSGSAKLVITPDTKVEQLLSIPGIFDEDDDEEMTKSLENAQAILATLKVQPPNQDVDENRDWWPYKDWDDLRTRVEDEFDVELGQEASKYIEFQPSESSVFRMKITGESLGMRKTVECECYYNSKDKKVRYVKWKED